MNLNREGKDIFSGILQNFSKDKKSVHKDRNLLLFDNNFCTQGYIEKPIYSAEKSLLDTYSSIMYNYPIKKEKKVVFFKKNIFYNKKKEFTTLYWGKINQFIDVEVVISQQTQEIIEECINYVEPTPVGEKRQQIYSLPQLCKYHKLTHDEIIMLCYILYDCPHSINEGFSGKDSIMSRARHLCKERRYLLRLTPNRYRKMLQHIILVDTKISISEITVWLNAISRIYHLITTLLYFDTSEENIFLALYNLPRKVICSAAEGCIVDKSIVNSLKSTKAKNLKEVQEIIIISEAIKIIKDTMSDEKIFDPRMLLETINSEEYMGTVDPVFFLIKQFNFIDEIAPSLIRIDSIFLQYIMNRTKPTEYTQEYFERIECLAYTLKRIIAHNNIINATEKEGYIIIDHLFSLPEELVVFYGIHPQEYEKKHSQYHNAVLPSLAYIQYNKEHEVYPHALSLMKYIPLELYTHEEKAYQSIQEHYENIIEHYPMLLSFPEKKLAKLLKIRMDYKVRNDSPYQIFEDVENIIEALKKIEKIRDLSFLSEEKYMRYLCTISINKVKFIRSFPEIVSKEYFKKIPIDLFNKIYALFLQERRMCGEKYDTILIHHISPLELLPKEYTEKNVLQEEELLEILRNKLEEISVLLAGMQYEVNDVSIALDTIKAYNYSKEFSMEMCKNLLEHSKLVLDIYYKEEESNLRELCKKPKSILEKYRKEEK